MKYLFIVQGEGRGHLTQAVSLFEMLRRNGHQVEHILVGHAIGGSIAPFFIERVDCKITGFESPHLIYSKRTKSLSIPKTIWNCCFRLRTFLKSIRKIRRTVETTQPDCIINFYDGLAGIYNFLYGNSSRKMIAIAHQYYLLHPEFPHPKNYFFDRLLVNINSQITALGADKKLTLSFKNFEENKQQNIKAVPPLLRHEFLQDDVIDDEDFILAYITQPLYAEQLIAWHKANSKVQIHCFWWNEEYGKVYQIHENLTFHQVDDKLFLMMMKNCKAYVSTAGFESICEAFYLGKPTCMVPIPNHYEQACNAIDAELAGAGIAQTHFDLTRFLNFLNSANTTKNEAFKQWVVEAESRLLKELVTAEIVDAES